MTTIGCERNVEGLSPLPVDRPGTGGSESGGSGGRASGGSGGRATGGSGGASEASGGSGGMVMDVAAEPAPPAEVAPPVDMTAPPVDTRPPDRWIPMPGVTWDYQLTAPINPAVEVAVYDVPMFATDAATIGMLKGRGRKVICHVDFGTFEDSVPDSDRFPREVLGSAFRGDPDRRWLDIRAAAVLSVMRGRLDTAMRKGCDAVEAANLDAWDTRSHEQTGFAINNIDQLVYNRTIAREAQLRGLGVGLKGNLRQVDDLVGTFDFFVSERCYERKDCALLDSFLRAGKAVFDVEYTIALPTICAMAKLQKISVIKKTVELGGTFREGCPP